MKPKVGIYTWIGPYEYRIEDCTDMISPHTRTKLLSDLPLEDFVQSEWILEDSKSDEDFVKFWRLVRAFEKTQDRKYYE